MNTQNLILQIILGTIPLDVILLSILGVIIWNLIEVKSIRADLVLIRERLATLEERDRAKQVSLR